MSDGTIHGIHAVMAVLRREPRRIRRLLIARGRRDRRLDELLALAHESGIAVVQAERKALDELTGGARHQGVVAEASPAQAGDESSLTALLDTLVEEPLLLVLDGVTDPHNLGACLRTADAAGVHAVIVPKDRSAGLTPVVSKVACGAAETVPFIQVTNLARTLKRLQQRGIWLAGLAGEAEQTLYQANLHGPLAVVMGAEGQGLRRLTRETCDFLLRIPMHGLIESLNVSVATGVVLFEALRQRLRP